MSKTPTKDELLEKNYPELKNLCQKEGVKAKGRKTMDLVNALQVFYETGYDGHDEPEGEPEPDEEVKGKSQDEVIEEEKADKPEKAEKPKKKEKTKKAPAADTSSEDVPDLVVSDSYVFGFVARTDRLKAFINQLYTLADEARFVVDKHRIETKIVDPAHAAMVIGTMSTPFLENYKLTVDELEFGLDLDKMKDALKAAGSTRFTVCRYNSEKSKFEVKMGNLTRRIGLLDTAGMADPKIPNLEFTTKCTVKTADVQQFIKASKNVADHVQIEAKNNPLGDGTVNLLVLSANDESDEVTIKLDIEPTAAAKSLYPKGDYFGPIMEKFSEKEVLFEFSEQYPMMIGAEKKGFSMRYMLAPRIENE